MYSILTKKMKILQLMLLFGINYCKIVVKNKKIYNIRNEEKEGIMLKKVLSLVVLTAVMSLSAPAFAEGTHGTDGEISGRSVGAAVCSLLIWPGIGQAINKQDKEKNITHAVLGLTGVFRLWSFYDALVDRDGGVWHNRI